MEHQSITINCQRILLPKSYLKFIFFDFSFTVIAFYSFLDNLVLHYLPNICASLTTKFKLIHLTYNVGNSKNGNTSSRCTFILFLPISQYSQQLSFQLCTGLPKIRKCLLPLPAEVHLDPDFSSPFQWTKKWYLLKHLLTTKC